MDRTETADRVSIITAAVQLILIALMSAVFFTDPNGFAIDKTITDDTACCYCDGEIVYLIERGKMSGFVSKTSGISFVLFAVSEIILMISVILSKKRITKKLCAVFFSTVRCTVFIIILGLTAIPYDDRYFVYRPYEKTAEFHEISDSGRTAVICEDFFLRQGNVDVYIVDGEYNADKVYSFSVYEDTRYKTEFDEDGLEIAIRSNDGTDQTYFIPCPV